MLAYLIALNRGVHDWKKLEEYWKAAGPSFEGLGAKRLAVYTPLTALEVMGPLEGAVVIEFPDLATAKGWYESPAYRKARQIRENGWPMQNYSLSTAVSFPPKTGCRTLSGSLEPAPRTIWTSSRFV